MAEEENAASLLAKKDYVRAVQLLKREHEKYPSNPRIRLQYADALLGAGSVREAAEQYEATAKYYDDNGLTVQAIAVRKKAEKAEQEAANEDDFERTTQGLIKGTAQNIRTLLKRMRVGVRYNEFSGKTEITGLQGFGPHLEDAAVTRINIYAEDNYDMALLSARYHEVIPDIARASAYHPVRDYLDGVQAKWDGVPRLATVLRDYFGAEDTKLNTEFGRLWFVAAVRRIRQPGVKFDQILILESDQVKGKSTAMKAIFGMLTLRSGEVSLLGERITHLAPTRLHAALQRCANGITALGGPGIELPSIEQS